MLRAATWIFLFSATTAAAAPPNSRSWIAVHVFDSMYPMTEEQTFPEVLGSLEIMNQLFTKRKALKDLGKSMGLEGESFGDRSREGHYLLWLHFSDAFVAAHPGLERKLEPQMLMMPGRKTDVFTAWSGSVNISAFLRQGVRGLAVPIRRDDGRPAGDFQGFGEITGLGDADYAAGWYLDDAQAERALGAFESYPGHRVGYSFMIPIEQKPNAPYEPTGARLVNGYNCGDFVFHALTAAGVVSREEVEALKVWFWYPRKYFDAALPLKGTGKKGREWLDAHPDAQVVPGDVMIKIAWQELLLGWTGLEFFDKRRLVDELLTTRLELEVARIWDQAHTIAWLKRRADFVSKGIHTELARAVKRGEPITSPVRTVVEDWDTSWLLSFEHEVIESVGTDFEQRKLEEARISGRALRPFRAYYESLKRR